ncbi:MAG: hypothetical protein HQ504_06270 [Rhodospirillaceae bacterium]|nr:hypothetical protein [Rhodospirillaceae bacterium]
MFNPVAFSFKIHQAALDSAASATRMMTVNYLNLLEQQRCLLQHTFSCHRAEDGAKPKRGKKSKCVKGSPCHGPDLQNHYGKRAHDVDIEHV